MQRAQASIEYLLLLAALLFFFSMLLPLLQKSYALSFFAVDVGNAKRFAAELQRDATEMSFFADGSATAIEAKPVEKWHVKSDGSELFITVKSASLQAEKVFTVKFPNEIDFQESTLSKETTFFLRKEGGSVLLENPH